MYSLPVKVTRIPLSILVLALTHTVAAASTKYLAFDSRIIAETENARIVLGEVKKHETNPLFGEDKTWEPRFDNLYANVLYDETANLYKCWYSPFLIDERTTSVPVEKHSSVTYIKVLPNGREMGVCYAESEDGIHWRKPNLGIVDFNNSEENNIVFRGPHGAGVFRDSHETDPSKRYKMVFKDEDKKSMGVAFSPDGLHWSDGVLRPEIDAAGDTHNNALWNPDLNRYVLFTRLWSRNPPMRIVGRSESQDFLKWSKATEVLRGLEPHLHLYAMPVFRCGGVYIGFPAIFNSETDRTHTELAWSPDTVTWHRICPGTPFIPNTPEEGAYDWGCVYAAAYPVFLDEEIRLYYGGSDGPHTSWRKGYLCLATLRPDGFAGFSQISADEPAVVTTKPFASPVSAVSIAADMEAGGHVEVEAIDESGKTVVQGHPMTEPTTDGDVLWKGGGHPFPFPEGRRLRFRLTAATLYSFTLGD